MEHGGVQPHVEHLVEHGNGDRVRRVLEHGVDLTARAAILLQWLPHAEKERSCLKG